MNDPIHLLCKIPPEPIKDDFLDPFILSEEDRKMILDQLSKISFDLTGLSFEGEKNNLEPIYCDVDKLSLLNQLKEVYSHPDVRKYLPLVYPYEKTNNSIFMNRGSLKIADLDKVFQLTGHLTNAVNKQVSGKFVFCDIAGGPGGFTQYLQYRWTESMGFGITYKKEIDWNINQLDATRFIPIYGNNAKGDGNLYFEWDFFAKTVKRQQPQGVDLVVADGGFDVSEGDDFERQEFLSTRLILIEILLGIMLCKEDKIPELENQVDPDYQQPSFVFKVFETVTEISAFLLLICSLAFEEVHLWKPVMSRWTNSERYVICRKKKPINEQIITLLVKMVEMQTDEMRLSNVKGFNFPEKFTEWLIRKNNESINLQIKTSSQMIRLIDKDPKASEGLEKVNIHQLLIVLDLPSERYPKTNA